MQKNVSRAHKATQHKVRSRQERVEEGPLSWTPQEGRAPEETTAACLWSIKRFQRKEERQQVDPPPQSIVRLWGVGKDANLKVLYLILRFTTIQASVMLSLQGGGCYG